jgi:hypothetical protein
VENTLTHLGHAPTSAAPMAPTVTMAAVLVATKPPPLAQGQPHTMPTVPTTQAQQDRSVFADYLNSQLGVLVMNKQATTATHQWQNLDGDNKKVKAFWEQALHASSFTPSLAMTEGSHLVSIIYGITVYSSPTAITALNDKAIGFCGNAMAMREPTAILLQQQKAWSWKTPKITN